MLDTYKSRATISLFVQAFNEHDKTILPHSRIFICLVKGWHLTSRQFSSIQCTDLTLNTKTQEWAQTLQTNNGQILKSSQMPDPSASPIFLKKQIIYDFNINNDSGVSTNDLVIVITYSY